jgi:hypothetical protein
VELDNSCDSDLESTSCFCLRRIESAHGKDGLFVGLIKTPLQVDVVVLWGMSLGCSAYLIPVELLFLRAAQSRPLASI